MPDAAIWAGSASFGTRHDETLTPPLLFEGPASAPGSLGCWQLLRSVPPPSVWALEHRKWKRGCLPSRPRGSLVRAEAVSCPLSAHPAMLRPGPAQGREHSVLAAGMSQEKSAESHRQVQPPSPSHPFLESRGARANHSTELLSDKQDALSDPRSSRDVVIGAAQVA